MKSVLRIVAEGTWRDASTEHVYAKHSAETIRTAGAQFLGTVLFDRASDPYRVLALQPGASADEVRDNKRLLLKWLHPDRNPRAAEQEYLARVLDAVERIESGTGKAKPSATLRAKPRPPLRVRPAPARVKPAKRTRSASVRLAISQAVGSLAHTAKFLTYGAIVTLGSLTVWRYVMDEPIGVSISRYSKLALGLMTW
ncbi:hypothetical protein [Aestuariivirga sp.]|uniref:hypothetical protein n=1 Tax=Aestuariivirga sp. TaxID=2650926 RepID=UPI003BA8D871